MFSIAIPQNVVTGADLLFTKHFDFIKGKNVGLVVNHTALLSNGQHLADAIHARNDVKLIALFGPEHGVRGDTTGPVHDAVDKKTGVPMYSLYGKTYKPTPEMMKGIDVLIYDIQDVGARFYTYISTLGHAMEAAAEHTIPMIVLDRPNPIQGLYIDGPVRHDTLKSFVAFGKIPIAHGMTVGELALMYNGEQWLEKGLKADLKVIAMENWKRTMWYDQTGLKWVRPSPNMPTLATATVYTGTCLFEGVNISEGRGTDKPFEYISAPWIDVNRVAQLLKNAPLKGVSFQPNEVTPTQRPNNARAPKYNGEPCKGIFVDVTDRNSFEPVKAGIYLLWAIRTAHPDQIQWRQQTIDRLSGTVTVRTMIDAGKTPQEIFQTWQEGLEYFKSIRSKYLLYN
jgi:uncharacterized protein YbbC (DUF1343 family)